MPHSNSKMYGLPPAKDDQVFVKVAALHGGFLTLPEELFVSDAVSGKAVTVPSLCFLIEHRSTKGQPPHRIVFDLGLKRDVNEYVEGMRPHIGRRQPIIHYPDTKASLEEGGLDPATNIDTVVLSHIHWDHVGTPADYPRSTFIVGSGTLHALEHGVPHYPKAMMERDLLPAEKSLELQPTPTSPYKEYAAPKERQRLCSWEQFTPGLHAMDFFGDGSMYLVDSPGHMLGHLNVLLRVGPERWIYLGGDCAHDPRLITGEKEIATYSDGCGSVRSVHSDLTTARQTLSNIRAWLAANQGSVECIVAHDGEWAAKNLHCFFPGQFVAQRSALSTVVVAPRFTLVGTLVACLTTDLLVACEGEEVGPGMKPSFEPSMSGGTLSTAAPEPVSTRCPMCPTSPAISIARQLAINHWSNKDHRQEPRRTTGQLARRRTRMHDCRYLAAARDAKMSTSIHLKTKGGVNKYPAKSHARRFREKLGVNSGILVAAGAKNVNWPNSDMPAPFRQDRSFYYLTGCNEPDCSVSYDIEKDKLTLWIPPVDLGWRRLVYYGRGSTTEEALEKYDVDEAKYLKRDLSHAESNAELAVLGFYIDPSATRLPMCIFDMNDEDNAVTKFGLRFARPSHTDLLQRALNACRVIKDEHEIDLVRRANDISSEAHTNVLRGMHKSTNEAEVEAAFMATCIARRAKEQAYDPIAGSGPNAAVLHYSANLAEFGKGQTVVLDAGCEVERYASDVTRTIPINKQKPGHWPSKEAEDIYRLVERVQESCIKQMLPGNKYIETTWHAHYVVIDGLIELGILKGDPMDIFHAGASMAFLPHGLGHHVGLDVHDVSPDPHPPAGLLDLQVERVRQAYVKWKPEAAFWVSQVASREELAINSYCHASLDSVDAPELEPGMIVTVEPGIYFNPVLLKQLLEDPKTSKFVDRDVLKRYIPVGGVRIEDCVLITKQGYENLTTAPKGEEMLQVIREAAESM